MVTVSPRCTRVARSCAVRVVTIHPNPVLPPAGFAAAMDDEIMMSGCSIGRMEFHDSNANGTALEHREPLQDVQARAAHYDLPLYILARVVLGRPRCRRRPTHQRCRGGCVARGRLACRRCRRAFVGQGVRKSELALDGWPQLPRGELLDLHCGESVVSREVGGDAALAKRGPVVYSDAGRTR